MPHPAVFGGAVQAVLSPYNLPPGRVETTPHLYAIPDEDRTGRSSAWPREGLRRHAGAIQKAHEPLSPTRHDS